MKIYERASNRYEHNGQEKKMSKEKHIVLVADDDPGTRLLVKKKLEKSGYHVIQAKNGKEAMSRMTTDVSAAVLDLEMPDADGLECLRYFKKNFPYLAPIMLTASDDVSTAVTAMKEGALDYITKPVVPGQLVALVEKAVSAFMQSKRLAETEKKLERARKHELFVSSRIQQNLLLGHPPSDLEGLQVAHLSLPSRDIDGDFYDFIRQTPDTLDILVADVMGKGIMAAFMGAALKSAFLRQINEMTYAKTTASIPEPEAIVDAVKENMISQMEELETFVTLCYGRFILSEMKFVFVDCGHVRTIHYQVTAQKASFLHGVNMPLGFPDPSPMQQFVVPFKPGDLFVFYSDGLTEAVSPDGEPFGEDRLKDFIVENSGKELQSLVNSIREAVVSHTKTTVFKDDFTIVAVRVGPVVSARTDLLDAAELTLSSDLKRLEMLRMFVSAFMDRCVKTSLDEGRKAQLLVAVTEVMTNIIKHAYRQKAGKPVRVFARSYPDRIEVEFHDWGIGFDPDSVPEPVLDGSQENGMGCYIIARSVDEVIYSRDEKERRNSTLLVVNLNP